MLYLLESITILLLMLMSPMCEGHGRLLEPPSRSSMWRIGYQTPKNYDDTALFCGGVHVHYEVNGGKCGVCGDPWNGPRENEAGGKYAKGIIVRKYNVSQTIDVIVELTANHKGYFEFHICPKDDPHGKITNICMAKHRLKFVGSGSFQYSVPDKVYNQKLKMRVTLPDGLKCRACVLRWKYHAGNSWGKRPDGEGCVGCGQQEQFYGCADVAVGYDDVVLGLPAPTRYPPPWTTPSSGIKFTESTLWSCMLTLFVFSLSFGY